ncbi:hypothetical protein BH10BAC5_BH10BAC5_28040 [soil metagenome]
MYYQTDLTHTIGRYKSLELMNTNLHGKSYIYYTGSKDHNTLILMNDGLLKIHQRPFLVINYFDDRNAALLYVNSLNNPASLQNMNEEERENIFKHFVATMKYIPGGHKALFMNNSGSWHKVKEYI